MVVVLVDVDYFSMFRILQTGKNSNNHYYLACSGWLARTAAMARLEGSLWLSGMELYGTLRSDPPLRLQKQGVELKFRYLVTALAALLIHHVLFSYDFDCNGLFYFLGTRGLRQQWSAAALLPDRRGSQLQLRLAQAQSFPNGLG